MFKNDRISLAFVDATVHSPAVSKGNICLETKVFPAECRGRKCSYKGRMVVSRWCLQKVLSSLWVLTSPWSVIGVVFPSQADISWSVNGCPQGIIKQSMGQLPIMVKSKLCNLHGMSPKQLVDHHEEAEVRRRVMMMFICEWKSTTCKHFYQCSSNPNRKWEVISWWMEMRKLFVCWSCQGGTILLPCQEISGRTEARGTLSMVSVTFQLLCKKQRECLNNNLTSTLKIKPFS